MTGVVRKGFLLMAVGLLCCARALAAESPQVVVEVKQMRLATLLDSLFQKHAPDLAYVVAPSARDRVVTVKLPRLEFDDALAAVSAAADVDCTSLGKVYIFRPRPESLSLVRADADAAQASSPRDDSLPAFNGSGLLVDLHVEKAPIAEVVEQLANQASTEAATEARPHVVKRTLQLTVHPSVPRFVTVTARVHREPVGDVLALLVRQANLTYTVYEAKGRTELNIVPKPYLRVSARHVWDDGESAWQELEPQKSEHAAAE
jgi:hypothetical protein